MKKGLLIVGVDRRKMMIMELLESCRQYAPGWSVYLVTQGNRFSAPANLIDDWIHLDDYCGPHMARTTALMAFDADVWINLDDDMLLTPQTDYDALADRLMMDRSLGFLSGNWGRTEGLAARKVAVDHVKTQPIVYTGGGLGYRSDVASLIMGECPEGDWLFDDVQWSLTAYLAGYVNARYLGSIAIHRVCSSDGRRPWVRERSRILPDDRWISLRPCKPFYHGTDNDYLIPGSGDLTDAARRRHAEARKARLSG